MRKCFGINITACRFIVSPITIFCEVIPAYVSEIKFTLCLVTIFGKLVWPYISAVNKPVTNENHKCRVKKQAVIIATIIALIRLVLMAGLSLPKSVGNIDGKNAS